MKKLKKLSRKVILLLMSGLVPMTTLTGCGEFTIKGALNSYVGGMGGRFDTALNIAESLKNSGFISAGTYDDIIENIEDLEDDLDDLEAGVNSGDKITSIEKAHDLIQDSLMVDDSGGKSIYKAISALRPLGGLTMSSYNVDPGDSSVFGTDGQAEDYAKGDRSKPPLKWEVISNYITASNDSGGDLNLWYMTKESVRNCIANNEWLCTSWELTDASLECQGATFKSGRSSKTADVCKPIEIVPEELVDELNSKFEYEVYVLNPDLYQNYGNSSEGYNNSFDAMAADIQSAINSKDTSALDNYFSVAKDSNGNNVTIRTILNDNGVSNSDIDGLVRNSEFYTTAGGSDTLWLPTIPDDNDDSLDAIEQPLGKDILVTQDLDDGTRIGVMQIRVQEFDYEVAETINSVIGIFSNEDMNSRYMVVPDDNVGGRIYLVEYPVYAIEGFKVSSTNGSVINSTPSYALSGIGINFAQGHIVNYAEEGGVLTYKSTIAGKNWGWTDSTSDNVEDSQIMANIDMYYTSSLFGDDPKNSSFVVAGKSALVMGLDGKKFKVGTSEREISQDVYLTCPRIVLRDYIEATYAPEFTNDVNLAAFGRKVRLSVTEYIDSSGKITYPNNEPIAFYVDQAGNKLPTSSFLYISDFCDIDTLVNSNKVRKIVASGKQAGTTGAADKIANSKPLMSELACTTVGAAGSEVKPFTMFPGPKLAVDDYANFSAGNIRQRMWAVCVYGGIYNTDLITDWIDSTDPVASLDWWNSFLSDNGYGYSISKAEIINYVNKAYAAQIASVTDDVIISLDTIKDIDNIYKKEDNAKVASAIRTAFLVVGWILMVYAVVLLLCWAMDTNTDLGFGLMEKATFGHWTAVKYESDVPDGEVGEHSYLAFGKLMLRCVILIVVGIVLINVDVFALVSTLVGLFGKIASAIEELIK